MPGMRFVYYLSLTLVRGESDNKRYDLILFGPVNACAISTFQKDN